jgi:4-hydroxy-tetrahydrodipicolinate reductase
MSNHRVIIAGCAGRMGRALIREIIACPGLDLAGGFEIAGHPSIGADLGALAGLDPVGLAVVDGADSALAGADALIDFTTPAASLHHARAAAAHHVALVLGVTGMTEAEIAEIDAHAGKIAIVRSGNFSLGVNLLAALVEKAARALPDEFDIEIFDFHHRDKLDAPSGTALMLGEAAARGRDVDLSARATLSRAGAKTRRKAGDIGFASLRGGGVVGEHRVTFAGSQETIAFSHSAIDRALFARGAVAAARFLAGKPPGLYSMQDVLGLRS